MKKKLKIITGSSGYIGKALAKELLSKNIKFIGIDKKPRNDNLTIKLDLKNKNNTLKFFNKIDCDEIFHFGTYSAVAYKKNFNKCFMEDYISLQNILLSIKNFKHKPKLIFMSSSYVYSGLKSKNSSVVTEKQLLKPAHDFGFAKKFFEEYILKYYSNSIIFRLSNVFGQGELIRGNTIYNMAMEAKISKKVTVWGKGNRKLQYIYIGNLMKYLLLEKKFNGVFNLGGKEYVKISTLTKKICDYFKCKAVFLKNQQEGETLSFMSTYKLRHQTKNFFTNFEKNLNNYFKTF